MQCPTEGHLPLPFPEAYFPGILEVNIEYEMHVAAVEKVPRALLFLPAVALLVATSPFVAGQTASETTANNSLVADAAQMLPDAPGESSSVARSASTQADPAKTAKPEDQPEGFSRFLVHSDSIIFAHETAPPLTANQKVVLGLKQSVSPFAITGWVFSAGFAQLRNGSPNYGTDKGAYGARLGATALRNLSESVLGVSSWLLCCTKILVITSLAAIITSSRAAYTPSLACSSPAPTADTLLRTSL